MRSYHITTEFSAASEYAHPNSPKEPPSPSYTITPEGKVVKCVGNYMLGKKLGRGAFCKVKVATHMQTGCKYAIKILKPNAKKSSWVDIEREIRVLCGLKHPNVIGLHDVLYMDENETVVVGNPTTSFESAKKVYLVVDLAGNGELFDYIIKRKRLSEDEARWIFRQIVSAVEYLHAHCIAHRDLKPENILMDNTNTIKINDFGLSNFVNPDKKMKTFCGSPVYAAPEVMRKSYYDGVVADVWSLGVILFTMVTGCLPWKLNLHNNRIENVEDLLAGRFDIPVGVSTECATLLCKMLVPNPSQRAHLNEVRKHPWVNIGYMDYPARSLEPNAPVTEIDKVVLKQMEAMGYMQARVSQDVWGNKVKPSVTIYHTLLRRRNLMLLLNSTPAVQQQPPVDAEVKPSPKSISIPPKPVWKPLDTVYEEPDLEPTPPSAALPSPRSLAKWVKDLTSVKNKDVDFHETRVAIPTAHGLSNFLKRRHSVPETQQELRTMNELPKTASSGPSSTSTSTRASTSRSSSSSSSTSKKDKGIIQRIFSRRPRKSSTVVGVAMPAS